MRIRVMCITLLAVLFIAGCSSSEAALELPETDSQNSLVGVWEPLDTGGIVLFLSSGEVKFDQSVLLTSLNRFQNSQRARYTSRLHRTGRYELLEDRQLILYVIADWTGKGTGARRPQGKQVESRIVFNMDWSEEKTLTLRKKSMSQDGSETNVHEDEDLIFTLVQIQ